MGSAFYLKGYGAIQIQVLNYLGLFSIIYFGNTRPLNSRMANTIEFMNQFFVLISYLHLFCFSDWVPQQEDQYLAGYSLIAVILLKMSINLVGFFKKAFRDIYLICLKIKNTLKYWKNQRILKLLRAEQEAQEKLKEEQKKQKEAEKARFIPVKVKCINPLHAEFFKGVQTEFPKHTDFIVNKPYLP